MHNRLFVFVALIIFSMSCQAEEANPGSECSSDIYVKDSISITISSSKSCKPLAGLYHNPGFIIEEFDFLKQEILWGKFDIYATDIEYDLLDIDGDGINEIFTLFFDESSLWGFAHKISFNDSEYPILKTVEIPQSLYNGRDSIYYTQNEYGDIIFNAITVDSSDTLVISYDKKLDSIFIKR